MVEQADTGKRHCDSVFIASFNNIVVSYAASGLCHKFNAALVCAFYVVAKWKESIAAQ